MGRELYEKVNVTGTRTLLDAILSPSSTVSKLVYTSSGGVIYSGKEDICDADERLDYPAVALDAYNETKVAAEKMVLEANGQEKGGEGGAKLLTCAIRPAGIFGPGDRQMISGFYSVVKTAKPSGRLATTPTWATSPTSATLPMPTSSRRTNSGPLTLITRSANLCLLLIIRSVLIVSPLRPLGLSGRTSTLRRRICWLHSGLKAVGWMRRI